MEHSEFNSFVPVSRETYEQLVIYHDLLIKWQQKINLVSPNTISDIWRRHFLDSAQIFSLLSFPKEVIFDLGSGAGFPGLVISLLGSPEIILIESDQRKNAFLYEVIRQTNLSAKLCNDRIELFKPNKKAKIITARACAPLNKLLEYSYSLLEADGEMIFLKGKGFAAEIEDAKKQWMFHVEHIDSMTNSDGKILRITQLQPI